MKAPSLRQVLHERLANLATCTGHQDGFFTHTILLYASGAAPSLDQNNRSYELRAFVLSNLGNAQ
jgi:hypothetical protein